MLRTRLTLSAVPGLLPEDAQAAASIERDLEAVDAGELAAIERLIGYVWPSMTDPTPEYDARFVNEARPSDHHGVRAPAAGRQPMTGRQVAREVATVIAAVVVAVGLWALMALFLVVAS